MKITRKQIEEWNEKCGNGFKVNERQAIMWGQKRLYKYIINEFGMLQAFALLF